jgi:N-acylglucosamine-6-phosphate 2-epimerase
MFARQSQYGVIANKNRREMNYSVIEKLKGGLIVSCQAGPESALHGPIFMGAMAREAERAGAVGLRLDGPIDVAAARKLSTLPILGINKHKFEGFDPYITVTFELAREVVEAGANLVAMDGTNRPLPGGERLADLIARVHHELHVPVMADISTKEEGIAAAAAGADVVATTMSGYTPYSRKATAYTPDFELLSELVASVQVPVIVEGRVWTPEQLVACFDLGAHAVCIGSAVTSPASIVSHFINSIQQRQK